jgi:hypothetical protein
MDDFLGSPFILKRTFDGRVFYDAQDICAWLFQVAGDRDSADIRRVATALQRTLHDDSK